MPIERISPDVREEGTCLTGAYVYAPSPCYPSDRLSLAVAWQCLLGNLAPRLEHEGEPHRDQPAPCRPISQAAGKE